MDMVDQQHFESGGVPGRVEDGQEQVVDLTTAKESLEELKRLCVQMREHAKDFNDAIKATAKKCGVNAGNLKRYVVASVRDREDGVYRNAAQLVLMFEEFGGGQ